MPRPSEVRTDKGSGAVGLFELLAICKTRTWLIDGFAFWEGKVLRSGQDFKSNAGSVRAIWILVDHVWNVNRLVPELRFAQCFA
jgi:hypothetical protein